MFIRDLSKCKEIIAGDNTVLKGLFNPLKEDLDLGYSLAHAIVKPGQITYNHMMKTSEVYYILEGIGIMYIDEESEEVKEGKAIYIPPGSRQRIKNIGSEDLTFLCIIDPPWRPEDEEILEN